MKKCLWLILLILIPFTCACSTQTPDPNEPSDDTPTIEEGYRAFDESGQLLMKTNNIWAGIIKARDSSKSSNKCYVLDENDNVVFKYSSSTYYMYRSSKYISSTKNQDEAILWAKKHPDSYVLNGKGTEFVYVGKQMYTDDKTLNKDAVRGVENMSASYVYLFSEKYNSKHCDNVGYSYIEFKVEFSKATLKYFTETSNEHGWNAYVFSNIMCDNPWTNCDMGIIQGWESEKGKWIPVFNYNGKLYSPGDDIITQMKFDEETGCWTNADDLFFRCYVTSNEYVLNITNLTTNVEYHYTIEDEKLKENAYKSYVLLAASNCPVSKSGDFWNPRCENSFENIIFRNVKIAKYQSDGNYSNCEKFDFYPDTDPCSYTLVMGSDNANCLYGNDEYGKFTIVNMYNDSRDRN